MLMGENKDRLLVEHSTGKLFIGGKNLEALAVAIHDEKVSEIKVSGPALSVQANDPSGLMIDSLTWENSTDEGEEKEA